MCPLRHGSGPCIEPSTSSPIRAVYIGEQVFMFECL
jgi:hypothetical protein